MKFIGINLRDNEGIAWVNIQYITMIRSKAFRNNITGSQVTILGGGINTTCTLETNESEESILHRIFDLNTDI